MEIYEKKKNLKVEIEIFGTMNSYKKFFFTNTHTKISISSFRSFFRKFPFNLHADDNDSKKARAEKCGMKIGNYSLKGFM
jgi:hypothetical protein